MADPRELARTDDPWTSHQAAHWAVKSGLVGSEQQRALGCVVRWPGRTATELAKLVGDADPRRINRRLGELERKGVVHRGNARRCSHTGRAAATWWAVGSAPPVAPSGAEMPPTDGDPMLEVALEGFV